MAILDLNTRIISHGDYPQLDDQDAKRKLIEEYYSKFYGPEKDPQYDVQRKQFIIKAPFFEKNLD